ncbi:hypothetical protein CPB85DRAFT_1336508 [Mucidula mucida]|nr:hypothetical protein CPB85DRAFT_1336508 [Mucidula mucida]
MLNLQTDGATLINDSTCISGSEVLRQSTQLDINSLPLEILLAIFASLCTDRYIAGYHHSVHVERCSRMSLMCTCRLWYNIVMDAPELWCDLQLCLPIPPTPEFLLRLRNILERSKDRPMSIELSQSMTGEAAARRLAEGSVNGTRPQLFPDLLSTSDRWVSLTAGAGLMVGSLLAPLEHSIPRLRDLIIRGKLFPVSNHTLRMFDSAPSLRRLVLQPVAYNIPFDHLWPRLTEFEGRFDDTSDLEAFVQILRTTPALRLSHLTVTIPKEDKTSFFRRIVLFLRQSRCVLSTLEISQWNLRDGAQVHILLPFLANLCSAVECLDLHFCHYDAIHVSNLMQHALGFLTDPDPSSRRWLLLRSLVIRIQFKLSGLSAPAPSCLTLDAIRTIRSMIEAPYRLSTLKTIDLEINFLYTLVDEKDCAALSALLVDHGSTLHIKYNGMSAEEILG